MFTFFRNFLRNRAVDRLIEAEREYREARRRFRRAERLCAAKASSPLGEADEVFRDLALARARGSAARLLAARARCRSLSEPGPAAPALAAH